MNRLVQLKKSTSLFVITLAVLCFGLLPAQATDLGGDIGNYSTADGVGVLLSNTGVRNSGFGFNALQRNTTGVSNTATGNYALQYNNTGDGNTAIGVAALVSNTTGSYNTATGLDALAANTTGNYNTATGLDALYTNTFGNYNTATGQGALYANNTGTNNTATGSTALFHNTMGYDNTATGVVALFKNATGHDNTAGGYAALYSSTSGGSNTASGAGALLSNTTANYNTAIGSNALRNNTIGSNNTAVGLNALLNNTGPSNVALGFSAGSALTAGSGNVCIGAAVTGVAGETNTTHIRNIYSSHASARAVYVNSDNKLGTLSCSRRYKEEIKPMDKASETLFALKPVTFHYKKEVDAVRMLSFGLIAEEVAEISPDLVSRDEEGKPQTVRYEAVNAMLLNEFLKEHKKVEQQQATIVELKSMIAEQQKTFESKVAEQEKRIEALASGLPRVAGRIETTRSVRPVVFNHQ